LRALGFDPSNEEIVKLIKELDREIKSLEEEMIDFQEFLEIMIVKMVAVFTICANSPRARRTTAVIFRTRSTYLRTKIISVTWNLFGQFFVPKFIAH
jgi:hypothetical protein